MEHLKEIHAFDTLELRQVKGTRCLIKVNGKYAIANCRTICGGVIVLIDVPGIGQRVFSIKRHSINK